MGSRAGAIKRAALMTGSSVEEYDLRILNGQKWCTGCRAWHPRSQFCADLSRGDGLAASCRSARRALYRSKATGAPMGPPPAPARDGDVKQARQRVNVLVRTGRMPRPSSLPCADCGHVWTDGERRHEYDHHLGYAAEHHLVVEAVCTTCHHARERARAEADLHVLAFPAVKASA